MGMRQFALLFLLLSGCGSSLTSHFADKHRAVAAVCAVNPIRGIDGTYPSPCSSDADCSQYASLGEKCEQDTCTLDKCRSDADCPSLQTCDCVPAGNPIVLSSSCVAGNCRVDADCGTAHSCSPDYANSYWCHTDNDDCNNDRDCPQDQGCVYQTSRWICGFVPNF